ncbi:type I-E CRISPR-associated protein Cas7/Cse4/CasC [Methylomonas paludis]|uniref:Type I-E CRISPR-associated protein Cas7/Cse4/CasC n=1 Tax=Methylomonas paludis TaxID=1173101 RepID=A0A975MMM8_9GAMM|nr:type I-E CRISPR-associated protein Cas7/Cse4/CasC [Methylomonas paludis]QWF70612.1 type I-E CRISPR-associated protein Cas7/Cse4/CasC [Methylomonas paludis]
MTEINNRFIQLHLLVSYPPSNPNRDELGQPKVAVVGGTQRSRISSQSLKRAWRTSEIWEKQGLRIGKRTRELFFDKELNLYGQLLAKHGEEKASKFAKTILEVFVNLPKGKKDAVTEQPIHFSTTEIERIQALVVNLELEKEPTKEQLEALLDETPRNIDLAMFGRMIAKRPDANSEAAVQVAHAISINEVEIEPDFFTAVDDLNKHGSAHMGEQEFVSAIYYLYLCIDTKLLLENLKDKALAQQAVKALTETAAVVAPTGKQNSYANRAQAFYILAEKGDAQPRNLSLAFLKAMSTAEPEKAIEKLQDIKNKFNTVYSKPQEKEMNLFGEGTLQDILDFVGTL